MLNRAHSVNTSLFLSIVVATLLGLVALANGFFMTFAPEAWYWLVWSTGPRTVQPAFCARYRYQLHVDRRGLYCGCHVHQAPAATLADAYCLADRSRHNPCVGGDCWNMRNNIPD